jgi:hypothetical protein
MVEPTHIFDEGATTYATGTDCWNILTDEMHSLYLLSFLLTPELDKAEEVRQLEGIGLVPGVAR